MPHTFLAVGENWINLDQVTRIEFVPTPTNPRLTSARVHYASGKQHDFDAAADVQTIATWLRAHQAP